MEYWTVDAEGRCTECPFNGQCRYQENDVKHKCNNEMTQEEKAKAYDEAIERAREMCAMPIDKATMEYVFPELKKSEGEESKKWILEYLHDGLRKSDEQFKDHFRTAIAWLEKQGKHKFNIGDTISNGYMEYRVVDIVKNCVNNDCYSLRRAGKIVEPFLWDCEKTDELFEKL